MTQGRTLTVFYRSLVSKAETLGTCSERNGLIVSNSVRETLIILSISSEDIEFVMQDQV